MKCWIIIFFVVCSVQIIRAQEWFDDPKKYGGVVVLNNKSSIKGVFAYDQTNEKLVFENGKEISSSEAFYFQFYNHEAKSNNYFFSFKGDDNSMRFYELLLSGEITLYGKSTLVEKSFVDSKKSSVEVHIDKKIIETQLYFNINGLLMILRDFENQILPQMTSEIKAISNYIVSKQLDIDSKADQIMILEYYNDIKSK